MKNLLILVTMLLTFGFANAQSKVYSGDKYGKNQVVGYYEDGKIWSGDKYGKNQVIGYYEAGKIYSGDKYGKNQVVGYYEGPETGGGSAGYMLVL